jgi:hypothetical protein
MNGQSSFAPFPSKFHDSALLKFTQEKAIRPETLAPYLSMRKPLHGT